MATLDIDNRERKVLAHEAELSTIKYEKKQLAIGDYVIRQDNNILAVIERKSLTDYADSMKDGRCDNRNKMLALRAKTNCRVIYIIEGPKNPPRDKKYGNIPFSSIKRSIFHLLMRDNITAIYTTDTLDTAKELVEMVRGTDTLMAKIGDSSFLTQQVEQTDQAPIEMNELTTIQPKSTQDIVRAMWACFRGVTVDSCDIFIAKWTLAEIISGKIAREDIYASKTATRRAISKTVCASLTTIGPIIEKRLLAQVPQISAVSAGALLTGRTLAGLLSSPVEMIASFTTGKKETRLGDARAARILELFNYTTRADDS